MPHGGYANPFMNDGPGFHSNMPVSKLTERVTRAIEASDISSTPLVAETTDGAMITRRPNARSQNDGSDPREGVRTKTRDAFSY